MKKGKKNKYTTEGQLPLNPLAFRLSALSGSCPIPEAAGSNNIPPNSQDYECVSISAPGIDYLTVMFRFSGDIELELERWEQLLTVGFDRGRRILSEKPFGMWTKVPGSFGSVFEYKYTVEHSVDIRISGGGGLWGSLDEAGHRKVFEYLSSKESSRVTRIDLKLEDRAGLLSLDVIGDALREREYSGYNCGEIISSYGGARAGTTVYFGGRKSEQRLRFYDKAAEQGSEGHWVRQELQCRGKRANEIYAYLFQGAEGSLWERVASRVVSSITFGHRKGKNLSRIEVAEFWIKWLDYVGGQKIPRIPIPRFSGIERTIGWMARSVAKSLAKTAQAFTVEGFKTFISALIQKGDSSVCEKEWAEIAFFRENGGESWIFSQLFHGNMEDIIPII